MKNKFILITMLFGAITINNGFSAGIQIRQRAGNSMDTALRELNLTIGYRENNPQIIEDRKSFLYTALNNLDEIHSTFLELKKIQTPDTRIYPKSQIEYDMRRITSLRLETLDLVNALMSNVSIYKKLPFYFLASRINESIKECFMETSRIYRNFYPDSNINTPPVKYTYNSLKNFMPTQQEEESRSFDKLHTSFYNYAIPILKYIISEYVRRNINRNNNR